MSDEKVPEEDLKIIKKNNDCKITTFINVGRHEERQKKLSRLIDAASLLKKDNFDFHTKMGISR